MSGVSLTVPCEHVCVTVAEGEAGKRQGNPDNSPPHWKGTVVVLFMSSLPGP
jgi:hypothetical protein